MSKQALCCTSVHQGPLFLKTLCKDDISVSLSSFRCVRLRRSGGIPQFRGVLPLRSPGGREERQHPVVDAAAVRPAPDLLGHSNSAGCVRHHGGNSALQKPGVPSVCGGRCMEVSRQ